MAILYGTFAKVDLLRSSPQLRAFNWAGFIIFTSWVMFLLVTLIPTLLNTPFGIE
jgi:hypothetical protein